MKYLLKEKKYFLSKWCIISLFASENRDFFSNYTDFRYAGVKIIKKSIILLATAMFIALKYDESKMNKIHFNIFFYGNYTPCTIFT